MHTKLNSVLSETIPDATVIQMQRKIQKGFPLKMVQHLDDKDYWFFIRDTIKI